METIFDKRATREAIADETLSTVPQEDLAAPAALTWLPGIVLAWAVGLIAASGARYNSEAFIEALITYPVLLGYASMFRDFCAALVHLPLIAGVSILITMDDRARPLGLILLAVGMFLAVVLWILERRGNLNASAWMALAGVVFLAQIWLLVATAMGLLTLVGAALRGLFYGPWGAQIYGSPARFVPRQFTLRDLFKWTTWLAVISAALAALPTSPAVWLFATIGGLMGCAWACLVIRLRPKTVVVVSSATMP